MKKILIISLSLLSVMASAQHCAFDMVLQQKEAMHPGFQESYLNFWNNVRPQASSQRNTVYELPVVFHIVYNTPGQNIPDEAIFSQLEILNQDYRRLNPDAANTREIFQPLAADAEIEFVLATTDPDGNPTTGINHVETTREGFALDIFSQDITLDEVKFAATGGADAWDTERYINIWVCNIQDTGFGQIFGFAYPPSGAPTFAGLIDSVEDDVAGIILHYTSVGNNNPSAGDDGVDFNDGGRTLTHEMGHYLGLRHTWGDGFFNGCSVDDNISDTPNQNTGANYNCDFTLNTCTDAENDMPDMIENYMDYNLDECYNMFTVEQVAMMRWCLENLRFELIEDQYVGLSEVGLTQTQIYPNPAADDITIAAQRGLYYLSDTRGRMVMKVFHPGGSMSLGVGHLQPGVYVLTPENGTQATRLVVQR